MNARRLVALAALAALPLLLAACDGGGDPVEQAVREASAKNQAATVKAGEVSGPEGPGEDHATPAAGPTAGDQAYIARMTANHQDAVAMAQTALRDSRDPEVRRMAQAVIDTRTREIAEMRAWRPAAAN